MSDIVKILYDMYLGKKNSVGDYWSMDYCKEAAETIEQLQSQNAELVEALEHIANKGFVLEDRSIARAALAKHKGE